MSPSTDQGDRRFLPTSANTVPARSLLSRRRRHHDTMSCHNAVSASHRPDFPPVPRPLYLRNRLTPTPRAARSPTRRCPWGSHHPGHGGVPLFSPRCPAESGAPASSSGHIARPTGWRAQYVLYLTAPEERHLSRGGEGQRITTVRSPKVVSRPFPA